ncbi:PAAR-like domain-containing protein [Salmonella enterica]
MDTNVFINGREACSKATDGKSAGAFPDPCWSPPPPPVGPIVVPYSNTAYARDLQNGTATVFICKTMVAQKDRSFFSTSQGNEPATPGFQKGVSSGVIKGKAYFKSWSPNVKFEGLEVPRHEDLMTHNHGSTANTPPSIYVDTKTKTGPCGEEVREVERHCRPKNQKDDDKSRKAAKTRLGKIVSYDKLKKLEEKAEAIKSKLGYKRNKQNDWIDDHCEGLMLRPWSDKEINKNFNAELANELKKLTNDLDNLTKEIVSEIDNYFAGVLQQAQDKATQVLIDKLEKKVAIKVASQGAKFVVKGAIASVPIAGWIISGAWAAYDVYDIWDSYDELNKLKEVFEEAKEIITDNKKTMKALSELMGDVSKKSPMQLIASGMDVFARLNSCTRARRCLMVRYDDTKGYRESFEGKGCCPGQTGHHLIPEAMAKSGCENYNHDEAPVICVEGVNQYQGSHKTVHDRLHLAVLSVGEGKAIKYDPTARDMAIISFKTAFPESKCDVKCLRAQLDAFYGKCKGDMTAKSGTRGSPESDDNDDNTDE